MRSRLAALLLLALACGTAHAQSSPRRDPSVHTLAATRDLYLGQTTITGSVTNTGYATLPAPKVTFALYDAADHEVGRLVEHADADLAPGQTWDIRTTTPLVFARYIPVSDTPAAPAATPAAQRASGRATPARARVAAPAKPAPVPKAATTYRKPELYDWSKHRRPAVTGTRSTTGGAAGTAGATGAAAHGSTVQRASPALRPGYTPRRKTAPTAKPSPSTKSVH